MASLKKNTASQNFTFCMVTTAGAADASATVTVKVTKDNGSQTSGSGTVTNSGNGQYNYAPTQSETNATDIGFFFTATGDVPVNMDFLTDVVGGTSGYPLVSVAYINEIITSSVTTVSAIIGQAQALAFNANNFLKVSLNDILATTLTESVAGYLAAGFKKWFNVASPTSTMNEVTLVDTVTTYTGNTPQTGDSYAIVNNGTYGNSALETLIAALNNLSAAGVWAYATRILTAGTNIVLAKGTGLTGLNDIAATAVVSSGAITTSGGAVTTVTTATNLTNAPTAGDFTAAMKTSLNAATPASVVGAVGSVTSPVSIAASQLFIKKNTALSHFGFVMTDNVNHNPLAGLTVSCTLNIDGAGYVASTNNPTGVANGDYQINFAAADMNGTSIAIRMTATGADDLNFTIITQA